MDKINTGKKVIVVKDELGIKGGGLYAYLPFSNLDKKSNAVFKVGFAIDFEKRTEQYHHAYPYGVYMVAFLQSPPVPKQTRQNPTARNTKRKHYLDIENFIFSTLQDLGAKRIYTTSRVKKQNDDNKGETEFFYTDDDIIHEAFNIAHQKYGGKLHLYYITKKMLKSESQKMMERSHYVGNVIFDF